MLSVGVRKLSSIIFEKEKKENFFFENSKRFYIFLYIESLGGKCVIFLGYDLLLLWIQITSN